MSEASERLPRWSAWWRQRPGDKWRLHSRHADRDLAEQHLTEAVPATAERKVLPTGQDPNREQTR
jgi:hypothetical protein